MTETIRYSLIGKEDLALGLEETKFEVTLADGRVVLMSRIDLALAMADKTISSLLKLQSYTQAGLPAAGTAGRVVWVSDVPGIYFDTGSAWQALNSLSGPPSTRAIFAGDGLGGGGDLSEDRTISWDGLPVKKNDTLVATRGQINFKEGSNVTLTVADNSGSNSVDVTIAASGGGGTTIPAGVVMPYAGSTAPGGYLLCDGSAVSRSTYSGLFTAISTQYGVGNGSTTFNLPDMRGRAVFGKDDMGGSAASRVTTGTSGVDGATLGAVGGDQRQTAHTHAAGSLTVVAAAQGTSAAATGVATNNAGPDSGLRPAVTGSTASTGGGSSQNMPPAIILNWVIKT